MEHKPFVLKADYEPAGDQPQAIAKLVEGIKDGFKHQTLLGVTGSGKSIGYAEPLYLVERVNGQSTTRIVQAGPFIDSLIESAPQLAADSETERFACVDREFHTHAYDPVSGVSSRFPVAALLRHKAPEKMYRLTTSVRSCDYVDGRPQSMGAARRSTGAELEPKRFSKVITSRRPSPFRRTKTFGCSM